MNEVAIVFPHQLFKQTDQLNTVNKVYLIEEFLFFKQYNFHKQKLIFHRASMKYYEAYLSSKKMSVQYINATSNLADIRYLIPHLINQGVTKILYYDTSDNWLEKRIKIASKGIQLSQIVSPLFINNKQQLENYFGNKKKFFQTDFYIHQRKQLNILIDKNNKPQDGKWSFDAENRLKYPKNKNAPIINFPSSNTYHQEALSYIQQNFNNNYGEINNTFIYPNTHQETDIWLNNFLESRLLEFGVYEDAIVEQQNILNHSLLTPMLNVGLITPLEIIEKTLIHSQKNNIPINSTEGFIRQIIGWREFIRAIYEFKGNEERTKNYWRFTRKIPASFWTATTGIAPIDSTIKKVLTTGYCHHIERLMVLGNFMLLCEFDPNEVYKWFMEMFIDAYDWVMVPNVYGMSQFADGGLMATKPYISGSNYLMKMSDYKKGEWQQIWDGLFWRFMHVHRDFFLQNPRLGMLVNMYDKMPIEKQNNHLNIASSYLNTL